MHIFLKSDSIIKSQPSQKIWKFPKTLFPRVYNLAETLMMFILGTLCMYVYVCVSSSVCILKLLHLKTTAALNFFKHWKAILQFRWQRVSRGEHARLSLRSFETFGSNTLADCWLSGEGLLPEMDANCLFENWHSDLLPPEHANVYLGPGGVERELGSMFMV